MELHETGQRTAEDYAKSMEELLQIDDPNYWKEGYQAVRDQKEKSQARLQTVLVELSQAQQSLRLLTLDVRCQKVKNLALKKRLKKVKRKKEKSELKSLRLENQSLKKQNFEQSELAREASYLLNEVVRSQTTTGNHHAVIGTNNGSNNSIVCCERGCLNTRDTKEETTVEKFHPRTVIPSDIIPDYFWERLESQQISVWSEIALYIFRENQTYSGTIQFYEVVEQMGLRQSDVLRPPYGKQDKGEVWNDDVAWDNCLKNVPILTENQLLTLAFWGVHKLFDDANQLKKLEALSDESTTGE